MSGEVLLPFIVFILDFQAIVVCYVIQRLYYISAYIKKERKNFLGYIFFSV